MVLEGRTLNEIRITRQQLGNWQYCIRLNVQGECIGSVTPCFCCFLESAGSQFCLQGLSSLCPFTFYSAPQARFWNAGRVTFVMAVRNIRAKMCLQSIPCAKTLSWRFKKLGSDMCFWVWSSQQLKLSVKNIHSNIPLHTIISFLDGPRDLLPGEYWILSGWQSVLSTHLFLVTFIPKHCF